MVACLKVGGWYLHKRGKEEGGWGVGGGGGGGCGVLRVCYQVSPKIRELNDDI